MPLRPASRAADDEGAELIFADVVAQHLGALRVLPDRHQHIAEPRVHENAQAEIDQRPAAPSTR